MAITKRTRADGTTAYVVREYIGTTISGRPDRKSVTCSTLAEAKVAQAHLVSMRDAMRNRSGRCTLSAYVETVYWPSASGLAATSRDTYRRELDKRILPAMGRMDVRDIDRRAVQKMVDGCATESVARKCIGVLRAVLNEAKGDGLVSANPACARYSLPPKGSPRGNGVVITTFGAMAPLMAAVDEVGGPCVEALAVLGLYMGLRPEERYALDHADVDLDRGVVSVTKAFVAASPAEGGCQLKETKTELSSRVVPIPAPAAGRLARLCPPGAEGPLLLGANGKRLTPSTAQKRWTRFLRACDEAGLGVPHVSIENMRHSFATSFLHAGGAVEDLSRILGHSDINTTYRRYVRPSVDDLVRSMAKVF